MTELYVRAIARRSWPLVLAAASACKPSGAAGPEALSTAGAASSLVGRDDGVGPLGASTKLDQATLAAALPGYQIERASISHGGDLREEYWAVKKGSALVLRVQGEDTSLSGIDIVSPEIASPLGVRVGATYAEVAKALGALDCRDAGEAVDWRAEFIECTTAKSDRYSLDFSGYADSGLEGAQLLADPAALAKAKLVAITWTPPGGAP
jgi:hypothetical protein